VRADDGLLVQNFSRAAAGMYQCYVSNAAGTATSTAYISVADSRQSDIQNIAPGDTYLWHNFFWLLNNV